MSQPCYCEAYYSYTCPNCRARVAANELLWHWRAKYPKGEIARMAWSLFK
jgi:hypothetical protein